MISRLTRKFVLALSACALVTGLGAVAIAAAASPGRIRLGAAPRHPAGSSVVGALPASTAIGATVALKPRDPAALQAYATAVSTPGSSVYHHYLTLAEFRQQFGPSDAQIAAVLASLRAHGLTPGSVTPNGLAIPVSATAARLSQAFSTSFQQVRVHSGRKAFANTSAPEVDSSVAGLLQGVIGLNSLAVPRPLGLRAVHPRASKAVSGHVVTGGPQPCSTASSAGPGQSAYTTDQLASAYGFSGLYGAGDEGAGQTVAIFELEPNFSSDVTAFKSCYGITTGTVTYTHVNGGPGKASAGNEDGIETELDMENVIGLAPAANVHVYQGPYYTNATDSDVYDTYSAIVTDTANKVISTSWGLCEQADPTGAQSESTLFQEAATQGQSVFAASGDSGSEDCGDSSLAVDDPASQPFVTGAGGTSLTSLGPPPTESVWNDQCSGGSCGGGGGVSALWQMPSYQSGVSSSLNVINSNSSGIPCGAPSGSYCREVPDVSADADPSTGYLIYWDGNGNATDSTAWIGIGGTSGAAPLWAGLMADVNASASCSAPVGFANPSLYLAAANDSTDFNDITSGNNALSGSGESVYPAGPGYDMASGLGTPNASQLAPALCGHLVSVTSPGNQVGIVGVATSTQAHAFANDGGTVSYSATGLPPGLGVNASTGVMSGTPTMVGTYSVALKATDGSASQTTVFSWTISAATVAVANPGGQTGRRGTPAHVQINAADNNGAALSYSATGLPSGLSMNGSTGLVSGTPSRAGRFTVKVAAADGGSAASTQFTWAVAGAPKSLGGSLAGIAKGKPRLSLTLSAGTDAPGIEKLVISLPKGLAFSGKPGKGLALTGANGNRIKRFKLKVSGGKLTITLAQPATQVRLAIGPPAISASHAVVGKVKHKSSGKLTVTVTAGDASGHTTTLKLKLNPS